MNKFSTPVFIVFFITIIIFNLYLFFPLVHALIFSGILAGTFYPIYGLAQSKLKLTKELASLATTALIFFSIMLPLIFIVFQISKEALTFYQELHNDVASADIKDFFFGNGLIGQFLHRILSMLNLEMNQDQLFQLFLEKVQLVSSSLLKTVNGWLANTIGFIFQFLMMTFAIYALFLKGDDLKKYIFSLSPLPDEQDEAFLNKFNQINFAIITGNGLSGIIQGSMAGIALWILGVPSVILITVVMIILAFIPMSGIALITIPITIITYLKGDKLAAVLLISYTTCLSLVVENYLIPKFIGAKAKINPILMLFYIIAGLSSFGILGIFYGPLCATFLITVVEIFKKNYLTAKNNF